MSDPENKASRTEGALPGVLGWDQEIARMIRVNHAGEYGAKRIYAGQLAVLKDRRCAAIIRHMAAQEEVHYEAFSQLLAARRCRPTFLAPLWHVAGYAMGAATALLGEKAAMACTVAVESVIDAHYAAQETRLGDADPQLHGMITRFRAEEKEHHDTALDHGAADSPVYAGIITLVQLQTKLAIWLSSRI